MAAGACCYGQRWLAHGAGFCAVGSEAVQVRSLLCLDMYAQCGYRTLLSRMSVPVRLHCWQQHLLLLRLLLRFLASLLA
jgi:hypothetical protein